MNRKLKIAAVVAVVAVVSVVGLVVYFKGDVLAFALTNSQVVRNEMNEYNNYVNAYSGK